MGEFARLAGITVRTLHHYDQLGLLSPARRSGAGYRLYTTTDLNRLQQIMSLRYLGLPLEEIGAMLRDPGYVYCVGTCKNRLTHTEINSDRDEPDRGDLPVIAVFSDAPWRAARSAWMSCAWSRRTGRRMAGRGCQRAKSYSRRTQGGWRCAH